MKHAVLLMAYGSPTRNEDVMEYLEGIYEGKPVPQYAIDENTRKYNMFGGKSPSNGIIEKVTDKLSASLSSEGEFRVFLGNKHWKPSLEDAVEDIQGYSADEIIALPLFPFPSGNVENSYSNPLRKALEQHGMDTPLKVINGFNTQPSFISAWKEVLSPFVERFSRDTLFLFSAHSLPVMRNPEEEYRDSFMKTAQKLAVELGIDNYAAAFQSRGKYGSTWLEPSVDQAFEEHLGAMGESLVAIPLGFIYDHLEILYDLDYEFGGKVRSKGKKYFRTSLPNDSDTFVSCLRDAVMGQL